MLVRGRCNLKSIRRRPPPSTHLNIHIRRSKPGGNARGVYGYLNESELGEDMGGGILGGRVELNIKNV